ncbi:MAG: hypothetical protein ACFFC7_11915 [Candidatus Hermodarchaeota archaeon]
MSWKIFAKDYLKLIAWGIFVGMLVAGIISVSWAFMVYLGKATMADAGPLILALVGGDAIASIVAVFVKWMNWIKDEDFLKLTAVGLLWLMICAAFIALFLTFMAFQGIVPPEEVSGTIVLLVGAAVWEAIMAALVLWQPSE